MVCLLNLQAGRKGAGRPPQKLQHHQPNSTTYTNSFGEDAALDSSRSPEPDAREGSQRGNTYTSSFGEMDIEFR
jgi:hypothetical protein